MTLQNFYSKLPVCLLTVLMLSVSQVACTASSLPPYEANYTTKIRGIRINSERKFVEIAADTYQLSWSARALWMRINEKSTFRIIDDKVIPVAYEYTRKGLGSDRPIHVNFDWENAEASGRKGDRVTTYSLEPGTLDKLSFQVQMQLDLINNREQQTFDYRVATHSGIRSYRFEYETNELLETSLGEFQTLVYRRDKKDASIRLWMSPQQFYLPVKVEQTGDDANTVVIKSWKSEGENTLDHVVEGFAEESAEDVVDSEDSFAAPFDAAGLDSATELQSPANPAFNEEVHGLAPPLEAA